VPCGVDTEAFRPGDRAEARARLGLPPKAFIALQLGRMVPRKGIDNVIEAIARLPAGMPAELVVVGGETVEPDEAATPELGRLRRLAEQLGMAAKVRFVGRRERSALRDWYVAADVFVTTPWYEPFGITPLEAMACGVPVIGAAVGGIKHTVRDGVTGYLVPPADAQALADRLLLLARHPEHARALGQAGLRRARASFTWERVTAQLATLYRAVRPAPQARAALHDELAGSGLAS
jgi:glycosyltransferase involved in cell wall biosynthesis